MSSVFTNCHGLPLLQDSHAQPSLQVHAKYIAINIGLTRVLLLAQSGLFLTVPGRSRLVDVDSLFIAGRATTL
jgi:hypothetical protein